MENPSNQFTIKRTSLHILSLILILGFVISPLSFRNTEAQSQPPNFIFPNEVPGQGELGGGTSNIVIDASGIRGDLVVRNHSAVWLTVSATSINGATFTSDDLFVNFGVMPPSSTVTYHGNFDQVDQKIIVSAKYDLNAWLWNTADAILGIIPGGDSLNPSALGETLTAIKGLNSIQKAAAELQAIKNDGWPSGLGHALSAANELRKLATDDQQAAALQAILTVVSINVTRDQLKDLLVVISIYEELKHIADSFVFFIVAPDGASVEFEAKYYGSPPPPIPPPPPLQPPPNPTSDNASFLNDITIPDGTVVSPGQSLTKIWRMKNTGSSTWGSGYKLVFVDAEQMGAPTSVDVPATTPGQEVDISVPMTAPTSDGEHIGKWRLRNPQGTYFGPVVWVKINVNLPISGGNITLFDVTPASPSSAAQVHIIGRARYFSDFRSMRFKIGNEVHEMENYRQVGDQLEISFDWNTASLARTTYALIFEVAKKGDNGWASPERQVKTYTLTGSPVSNNRPPERPLLKSPYNWYLKDASGGSASVELCVYTASDPDGNSVQYGFEVKDQGGGVVATSGWTSSTCWNHTYNPGTYSWRVKTYDGSAESDWSQDTWNFSVAGGNVWIGDHSFFDLNTNTTHLCVFVTYEGTQGPDVYAWLNKALDGSETGEWRLLDHYGPNTTPDCTQANYHGFWIHSPEYETGTHKLKITAIKRDSNASATKMTSYTIAYIKPPDPTALAPSSPSNNGTWWNARAINFQWSQALRADNYTLRVSTNSNPWADPSPVLNQVLSSGTISYTHIFAQDYGQLYWAVRATNSAGYGDTQGGIWFGIDQVLPTCQVQALPAVIYENVFQVNWAGTDNSAGVRAYDIQYRDTNRDTWNDWLLNQPANHPYELFNGQPGHTYYFRCRAIDYAGNVGDYPPNADTSSKVDPAARPPAPWWNSAYSYKRNLTILNNMASIDMQTGYPVHLHFDSGTTPTAAELYNASQSSPKCADIRVIYNNTSELNRIVDRCDSSSIDIWFRSQVTIPGGTSNNNAHQLYYGNSGAGNPPTQLDQVFWPEIDSNTLRYYSMREGSGSTISDLSGHSNATMSYRLSWLPFAKFGPAISFPTDNDPEPRPAIDDGSSNLPTGAFSIEWWMKLGNISGGSIANQNVNGYKGKWVVHVEDYRRLRLSINSPGDQWNEVRWDFDLSSNPTYSNNYHHYAITFNGDKEVKFYLDGDLISTKYLQFSGMINPTPTSPLRIGAGDINTSTFNGVMFDFVISQGVRTDFSHGSFGKVINEPSVAAGQPQTPPTSGSPDLIVMDLSAFPNPGGGTLVQAIVKNQGILNTMNGFFTDIYVDHIPTGSGDYTGSLQFWVNEPIPSGQTLTLTTVVDTMPALLKSAHMPLAPGSEITGTLYAQTDSTGALTEPNKTNNIFDAGTEICVANADFYEKGSAGSSLITNGDFEEGDYAPEGSPTGWWRDAWNLSNDDLIWDDTEAYSGIKSVKISTNTNNDIRWLQSIVVQPNTNYRLSGWIKTQNVAHSVGTGDAGANLGLYGTWSHTQGLFGTNDWTFVSMEFNSGAMTQVQVAARLGYWSGDTTGTAWFDNIRLDPIYSDPLSDDGPMHASLIVLGESQIHNFDRPGDQDWVKFNATAGQNYIFHTSNLGTSNDTYLYLYDTDGATLLTSNDDFGGALSSKIEWFSPANGVYYLLVKHWNPNVGGCGNSYHASVNVNGSASLIGSVTLQGRPAKPHLSWSVPLTISLTTLGAITPTYDLTTTTDQNGVFTITSITSGEYTIRVMNIHTLPNVRSAYLSAGSNTVSLCTLVEGDANNDTTINIQDFVLLSNSFFLVPGSPGFNARTDLNEDGIVNIQDFSLLSWNFGKSGDQACPPPVPSPSQFKQATGDVSITVQPLTSTVEVGEIFTVTVQLQTNSQFVDAAQVSLDFDPSKLKVNNLKGNTSVFPSILQSNYDNVSGKLDYAAGTFSDLPSGVINLVQIQFEALGITNSTPLTFHLAIPRKTDATYHGELVLTSNTSGQVIVEETNHSIYLPTIRKDVNDLSGGNVIRIVTSTGLPNVMMASLQTGTGAWLPPRYSLDRGLTWREVETVPWGDNTISYIDIAIAPREDKSVRLLVSVSAGNESGVYRTGDFGASWMETGGFYSVGGLISSPANPAHLFHSYTHVFQIVPEPEIIYEAIAYITNDSGINWQSFNYASSRYDSWLSFWIIPSPILANRVYVYSSVHGWEETNDNGLTWNLKSNFPQHLALDSQNSARLYSIGGGRSSDSGVTWSPWINPPCSFNQLLPHSTKTRGLLALCNLGLYRSTNAGDQWTKLSNTNTGSLVADYSVPGRMLWIRTDGVWVSCDDGASWLPINPGCTLASSSSLSGTTFIAEPGNR